MFAGFLLSNDVNAFNFSNCLEGVWSEVDGIGRKLTITIIMDHGGIYGLEMCPF